MPNIKSAIKRVKVAEKKTKRNNMIKSECKTAIKKYEVANSRGDKDAVELLSQAKSKIDSACSKGIISKNAASRKKSRLEKKLAVKVETKKATTKKVESKAENEVVDEKKTTTKKAATTKATAKKTTKKEEK